MHPPNSLFAHQKAGGQIRDYEVVGKMALDQVMAPDPPVLSQSESKIWLDYEWRVYDNQPILEGFWWAQR